MVNTGELYVSSGTELAVVDDVYNTLSGDLINDGELFVYADFSNEGLVDFLNGGSNVSFMGGVHQLLRTSELNYIRFSNVLFNNGLGFDLYGELRVDGEVSFIDGVVGGDNGLLILGEGSSSTGASNDSHVAGKVMKVGNKGFEYPIGIGGDIGPLILEVIMVCCLSSLWNICLKTLVKTTRWT